MPSASSDSWNARNVLEALNSLESESEFALNTIRSLPPENRQTSKDATANGSQAAARVGDVFDDVIDGVRARDMQTIGCLIVEFFLPTASWCLLDRGSGVVSSRASDLLAKRYRLVRNYLHYSSHQLHW
jgi:hypothetical protein